MTDFDQLLLEIETAEVRVAWASSELKRSGETPALSDVMQEAENELRALRSLLLLRPKNAVQQP
jgi:hypothetical protein